MYHSLIFAPVDMSSGDILTYLNIDRYSRDPQDPAHSGLIAIRDGRVPNVIRPQIRNTWTDWHLVPSTRPTLSPPAQKKNTIDIPGGYGSLDLSETLAGHPVYERRNGSFEFIVMNDFGLIADNKDWDIVYTDILNYLHGRQLKMILEDDRAYYYEGRFSVNEWRSEKDYSRIVIDYDVMPFKHELFSFDDHRYWYWDSFDFNTSIIQNCKKITTDNVMYVFAGREYSIPIVSVSSGTTTMTVARMYDYPYWGGNREALLSFLDSRDIDITYARDIKVYENISGDNIMLPDLEIGGNYIYGFKFDIHSVIDVELEKTASQRADNFVWGPVSGTATIHVTNPTEFKPYIYVRNENIGAAYNHGDRADVYTPGAKLTVTYGSFSAEYDLNNGENELDSFTVLGDTDVEFDFRIELTSWFNDDPGENTSPAITINYGGQYASIRFKRGEL